MDLKKKNIDLNDRVILVTGAAGFIGASVVQRLLLECKDSKIIGIDNLNNYYDVELKKYRLSLIEETQKVSLSSFEFQKQDIADKEKIESLFEVWQPSIVINLAAQAGVRYSIENPDTYISSNLVGFYNILEGCRLMGKRIEHLIYASSSSVYGGNTKIPFSEDDKVDHPVSLYAATKKSNELLAYSYSKLYNIPCTGLRFFTVYGPGGRPDMAYFSFTEKLLAGEKIKVFNYGNCKRDFTFIDDIVTGIFQVISSTPKNEVFSPYRIYNIGNSHPENLVDFVRILAEELVRAGILPNDFNIEDYMEFVPMQPGDVPITFADIHKLEMDYGFKPKVSLQDGLRQFVEWYKDYYKIWRSDK